MMGDGSRFWIHVWNGLLNDPKHRRTMGEAVWTYLVLLDWCDKETGKVTYFTYEKMEKRCGISIRTAQRHLARLKNKGYVDIKHFGYGLHIQITNYRPFGYAISGESKEETREIPLGSPSMAGRVAISGGAKKNTKTKNKDIKDILSFQASGIYEYYAAKIRPGAKQDSIRNILKLLTSPRNGKEPFTPDQLKGFIDNYIQSPDFSSEKCYRIQANNFFGLKARFEDFKEPIQGDSNYQDEDFPDPAKLRAERGLPPI